jgi:hypothetical protein
MNCDDEECKEQEEYFHKAERENNEDANQYKILYNMNGNSFSGRCYICLPCSLHRYLVLIFC